MRVRVEDFQSLQSVDFTATGLTVITGASNIGKTALIRAIEGALFGKPGDYYIKHGEHTTKVRLQDKDLDLLWLKTTKPAVDRQTSLKVNGTLHTKLGKDHWRLTEPLGFQAIETSYKEFRPQVAMQHDAPFLLTETETVIAEVMKQVSRADVAAKATDLARKDRRSEEALLKLRETDRKKAQEAVDELENLPKLQDLRDQAKKAHIELLRKTDSAIRITSKMIRRAHLQPKPIPPIPPEITIPPQLKLLTQLARLQQLKPRELPPIPAEINTPPQLELMKKLELHRISKTQSSRTLAEIESLDTMELELNQRKEELEAALGTCPTCQRTFDGHGH